MNAQTDDNNRTAVAGPVERQVRPAAETDEWKLDAFIEWRPKAMSIQCPTCNGSGVIGGGPLYFGGPENCPDCHGSGSKRVNPSGAAPVVPADLLEHMRRAWWDYFHKA